MTMELTAVFRQRTSKALKKKYGQWTESRKKQEEGESPHNLASRCLSIPPWAAVDTRLVDWGTLALVDRMDLSVEPFDRHRRCSVARNLSRYDGALQAGNSHNRLSPQL